MAFFARSRGRGALCFLTLLFGFGASGIATSACGHVGFEDLFATAGSGDGAVDGAGSDGAGNGDDGGTTNPGDDDGGADGGVIRDCVGPNCPGTYVSTATGDDTNPGTADKPVKTIVKGIELAATKPVRDVYVSAGSYVEKVTLIDRVQLFGGYRCQSQPCEWTRDIQANESAIFNKDFEGVLAPKAVTRAARIDGFKIVAKPGTPTAAPGIVTVTLDGGTPAISRCTIVGADSNGGPVGARRTIAVAILSPSNLEMALLDRNTITAGNSTEESNAVLFDTKSGGVANGALAGLLSNTIRGGDAPTTIAVNVVSAGARTILINNTINAGKSTNAGNEAQAWAVSIVNAAISLEGNRINVGSATAPTITGECAANLNTFCGGIISRGAAATLHSNVVFGVKAPRSCAVLIEASDANAGSINVNGNTLDGAGDANGTSTAIALRAAAGQNGGTTGRIRNNILLGGVGKNRYAIFEELTANRTIHPAAIENNDFFNPPPARTDFAYHFWNGGEGTSMTFAQMNTTLQTPLPAQNIAQDPQLDTARVHISAQSPCVDRGINSAEAPPRDIDNEKRPKGDRLDIGADEAK